MGLAPMYSTLFSYFWQIHLAPSFPFPLWNIYFDLFLLLWRLLPPSSLTDVPTFSFLFSESFPYKYCQQSFELRIWDPIQSLDLFSWDNPCLFTNLLTNKREKVKLWPFKVWSNEPWAPLDSAAQIGRTSTKRIFEAGFLSKN